MSEDLTRLLDSVINLAGQVRELRDTEHFIGNDVIAPAYAAPEGTPHFDTNLRNLWVNYDGTAPGWQLIGGGGGPVVHNILSASHGDAAIQAVSRGSLIYGDNTPQWNELVHPAAANRILTTDANDVLWSTWALVGTAAQTYTLPTASGTLVKGSGAATYVTYWTDAQTIAGDAGFTYDSANDILTLTPAALGGITFAGGATGRNRIQAPDNFANALYLDDAGGIEYLRITSTNAQPAIVINEGSADIDFRVESDGNVNMLYVDGGTNWIGVGRIPTTGLLDVLAGGRVVNSSGDATWQIASYSTTDSHVGLLLLRKSATNTIDSLSNLAANENIGRVRYQGVYGGAFVNAAEINCLVDSAGTGANVEIFARNVAANNPTIKLFGNGLYTEISDYCIIGDVGSTPATTLELLETKTLTSSPADGYAATLTIDAGYTGAFTVTRHNYIDVNDVSLAGGAALTDGAVFRFDANIGTHCALASSFNTTDSNGDTTAWAGGMIVNINGTLYKCPLIAV